VLPTQLHLRIKISPCLSAVPTNTRERFSPMHRTTQAHLVVLTGSSEKCLVSDTNHKKFSCNFPHNPLSCPTSDTPNLAMLCWNNSVCTKLSHNLQNSCLRLNLVPVNVAWRVLFCSYFFLIRFTPPSLFNCRGGNGTWGSTKYIDCFPSFSIASRDPFL
jgi:hypothetical protein